MTETAMWITRSSLCLRFSDLDLQVCFEIRDSNFEFSAKRFAEAHAALPFCVNADQGVLARAL
jgi:hypothetical protein